jgi:hypothetical protein
MGRRHTELCSGRCTRAWTRASAQAPEWIRGTVYGAGVVGIVGVRRTLGKMVEQVHMWSPKSRKYKILALDFGFVIDFAMHTQRRSNSKLKPRSREDNTQMAQSPAVDHSQQVAVVGPVDKASTPLPYGLPLSLAPQKAQPPTSTSSCGAWAMSTARDDACGFCTPRRCSSCCYWWTT